MEILTKCYVRLSQRLMYIKKMSKQNKNIFLIIFEKFKSFKIKMNSLATFVLFALTTLMVSSGCQAGVTNTQINPKDYVFDFKAIGPSLKGPGGK